MTTTHFLRRLAELTTDASTDELRIIITIAERLNLGRERYGALCIANDERDWQREAREEAIDMAIYRAVASLKERDTQPTLPPPSDDRAVVVDGRAEAVTLTEMGVQR